jgi:hypothetical protein
MQMDLIFHHCDSMKQKEAGGEENLNDSPITSRVNGIGIWIIWINEAIDDTINAADTKSAARNEAESPLGTPLTRQELLAHELPTFAAPVFCLSPKGL